MLKVENSEYKLTLESFWRTGSCRDVTISNMSPEHLINAINMLSEHPHEHSEHNQDVLRQELIDRQG